MFVFNNQNLQTLAQLCCCVYFCINKYKSAPRILCFCRKNAAFVDSHSWKKNYALLATVYY